MKPVVTMPSHRGFVALLLTVAGCHGAEVIETPRTEGQRPAQDAGLASQADAQSPVTLDGGASDLFDARGPFRRDTGPQTRPDTGSPNSADAGSDTNPLPPPPGYTSLFIGHSFFAPIARGLPQHAQRLGLAGHSQDVIFSGGATGAPEALWNHPNKSRQIKAILDQGDIELFGMTYHPDYPSLEGYIRWIDYALTRRADTTFFIALPWQTQPGSYDSETYANNWALEHPRIAHGHLDELRARYPDSAFFCIPYGEGATVLHRLQSEGRLPGIEVLMTAGDRPGVFRDALGHAEPVLIDLSELIWLQAIYGVDLEEDAFDPGYDVDLKRIATEVMARHDSSYDAP